MDRECETFLSCFLDEIGKEDLRTFRFSRSVPDRREERYIIVIYISPIHASSSARFRLLKPAQARFEKRFF